MRLLLLGANGQVGHALIRALVGLGELTLATRDGRLHGRTCEAADLADPAALQTLVARLRPDVVVNAAAYTAVDRAEAEPAAAYAINATAVDALARACATHAARLVHYSTDYVFPGDACRPRRETDPTGPTSAYGASKLAGEDAVRASGCAHVILRTAWVYGAYGHNFLRTMLRLGAQRAQLQVVDDQIGSPTPAAWIAQATAHLLRCNTHTSGTWHLVAGGATSWHGFAQAIFDDAVAAGLLPRAPQVQAIPSADYPTPARRPAFSQLDTTRLQQDLGIVLPDWRSGVHQVITDLAAARQLLDLPTAPP